MNFIKTSRLLCLFSLLILWACEKNTDIVKPKPTPTPPTPPSTTTPQPPAVSCGKSVIAGYTAKTSYFPGDTLKVFIQSNAALECGLSFYDVNQNFVFSSNVSISPQPVAVNTPWETGFNFTLTAKILLPLTTKSGVYFIENQIPFVVKSTTPSDIVVVYPSNTINAYNNNGGKSLYGFNSSNSVPSPIVSFLRPLPISSQIDLCIECLKWFPSLPNITIRYICDMDMDDYSLLSQAKVLIIAGHSEYWTRQARTNFDAFVNSGRDAILLSGNSMWWQVRYSVDRNQLICYRNATTDPETNPLLKTILWTDSTLQYSIIGSIGADFDHGGYGLATDRGWDGFKIANGASPLLEGLNMKRGDILSLPSGEYDGAPIKGFDADGFPILDNPLNFFKLELVGFDKGSRNGVETIPTFIALQRSALSGAIVNMASYDWCSYRGMGSAASGDQIKTITKNAVYKLLNGTTVFSN